MALFSAAVVEQINQVAAKSNEELKPAQAANTRSMNDDLNKMSKQVIDYFKDSPAILITTKQELHDYVDTCIEKGYAGIDTETTGLDRLKDWVVGASLYTPGLPECYIPMKHRVPIFETPYKHQLEYEEVQEEFQRLVDGNVKLIFANADYDLAMIYKDLHVDMIPAFYYDVILAWRCIKENELDNSLKGLYAKYVMKGKVDPKKFSDFFSPTLFPYCKPEVAKLYAANDAKITYELFLWQLPYVTPDHEKCKKHHMEKIANLVWNIEFQMVAICALLHRRGVYLDDSISATLHERYMANMHKDEQELARLVQDLIDTKDIASNRNRPFRSGADFNPNSQPHVKYLVNNLLGKDAKSTGKDILKDINHPSTNAVLKVRGDVKLIGTYVDKMPKAMGKDHRVHSSFKSTGAATGRMCVAEGQPVLTSSGFVSIQDIEVGSTVFSYNMERHCPEYKKVLNVWKTGENKECVRLNCKGASVICTPEHPILTYIYKESGSYDYRWVPASEVPIGAKLLRFTISSPTSPLKYDNTYQVARWEIIEVQSIDKLDSLYTVYDIEVEDSHNFYVDGICVHNSSESPNAQNIPSKSHDIRHMFRATPEMTELISINTDSNTIELSLSKYDSVPTPEGKVEVKDLKEGSIVIMHDADVAVHVEVQSIEFELDQAHIVFVPEELE